MLLKLGWVQKFFTTFFAYTLLIRTFADYFFFMGSNSFSTVKTFRWALCTDRGMVIVFPLCVTLNSPFTKGSHPARYCHCVPRINRDNSWNTMAISSRVGGLRDRKSTRLN